MPNTTNFNWVTPADTDLVKDGAAAIRTLGNGIDTSFLDLKGGTSGQILAKNSNTDLDFVWVANDQGDITEVVAGTGISGGGTSGSVTVTNTMATAIDAKGDLIAGTGADAFTRVAVGTNGQLLTADSTQSGGLAWTTVQSGGWTNLASGTLSGSSVSITSISTAYQNLHLVITGARRTSASGIMMVRVNSNTNNQYYNTWVGHATNTVTLGTATNYWNFCSTDNDMNSTANDYQRIWTFDAYATSARRIVRSYGSEPANGYNMNNVHRLDDTTAITSIQLAPTSGTFSGGSYILYGEK